MIRRALTLMAAALLLGCAAANVHHNLGEPVTLDAGTTAKFADGFSMTFTSVVSDSRCPAGVTCIQAGEALVELACSYKEQSEAVRVSSDQRRNVTPVLDHLVELTSITPRPNYSVTVRATAR